MSLAQLQRDFRAWLVDGSDDAARSFGAGAAAGLTVYQNNYRAQLVGCIEQSFPRVHAWLGDDAFLRAAITHIDSHPPGAWTLDVYARNFDETLTALFPDNPDLHELAWIENALSEAFVAPDAEPVSIDALSAIDWDSAQLRLSCRRLHSRHGGERRAPVGALRDRSAEDREWWRASSPRRSAACSIAPVRAP